MLTAYLDCLTIGGYLDFFLLDRFTWHSHDVITLPLMLAIHLISKIKHCLFSAIKSGPVIWCVGALHSNTASCLFICLTFLFKYIYLSKVLDTVSTLKVIFHAFEINVDCNTSCLPFRWGNNLSFSARFFLANCLHMDFYLACFFKKDLWICVDGVMQMVPLVYLTVCSLTTLPIKNA